MPVQKKKSGNVLNALRNFGRNCRITLKLAIVLKKIKIELDDLRNKAKKNNLRGNLWEISDELFN